MSKSKKKGELNKTTLSFIEELQFKPLDTYSISELQEALQKCQHLYLRFKDIPERTALNSMWNKMGTWYNNLLVKRFPNAPQVYRENYLLTLKEKE